MTDDYFYVLTARVADLWPNRPADHSHIPTTGDIVIRTPVETRKPVTGSMGYSVNTSRKATARK